MKLCYNVTQDANQKLLRFIDNVYTFDL